MEAWLEFIKNNWVAIAAFLGFLGLQVTEGVDFKAKLAKVGAYLSALKAKVTGGKAAVTSNEPYERRKAALKELRHLAAELSPEERTESLAVMDLTDAINARVHERLEATT